ncbi:serine/threonine-protein phosphatase [Occultella glacieicola]|uniref:Serine/threonine-protein phosphatase n=1 Tax=Occultella glacieicola TaxID=2518684 RepID=A0ABY2DZ43_9MICO|nr:serine/threonine-protein phosphatase [Occultella glacieicola]
MRVQTVWGVATDAGGRRKANEDSVLATPSVFLVADGMGGHVHGAMASGAVVAEFSRYADTVRPDVEVQPTDVQAVVRAAQQRIRASLSNVQESVGDHPVTAGSTAAGAILTRHADAPYWLVFNVGDSRVYRFAEGALTRISVDHSVVQELVDSGAITDEQARTHPQRNVITRAVGSGIDVEPDFWMLYAGTAERLLLCSDGLINELSEDRIAGVLGGDLGAQDAAAALLAEAIAGGARDNVSVIVVDLTPDHELLATTAPREGASEPGGADDTVPREQGAGADRNWWWA